MRSPSTGYKVWCFGAPFPEDRPRGHGGRERSDPQGAFMLSRSRRFRVVFVLMLSLFLFVSTGAWAKSLPTPHHQPARAAKAPQASLIDHAWSFLVALWSK